MVSPASITLTPSARPGGLLDAARPLPSGWERGVDVLIGSLTSPDRTGPCPVGSGEQPQERGELARFVPVAIRQGIRCSLLGRPDLEQNALDAAEATESYALSLEFYDGAATSNPSLADAVDLGTVGTVEEAISLLEDEANTSLSGRLAFIHVPVGLSIYLSNLPGRDGVLRTPAGNVVVVHGTGETIYATGEVWAATSTIEAREYRDLRTNTGEGWADQIALAVFDPEFNVGVTVDPTPSSI